MFRKLKRYSRDPYHEIGYDLLWKHPNLMPDKWYLKALWKRTFGYELDLKHPKTFNEKLQWLKLYDRKPEYTVMVDKYRAKQWVADRIGEQYVIPTLAVYNSVEEIDLDKLPNRFVLKCNHDSGSVVICKDKSSFDFLSAKTKLAAALKNDYYLKWREWPYKNVNRCIIAERYVEPEPNDSDLFDYKIFCFDGKPKVIQLDSNRFHDHKRNLYSTDWKVFQFSLGFPNSNRSFNSPSMLKEMLYLSEKLSEGQVFLRIDFYCVNKTILFGEITFYPGSGIEIFNPSKWNKTLGDWIKLPID